MFKIGEYVSYRSEGVCVITDIRPECFNALGKSEEYYMLSPIKDMSSVLYVPMNNEALTSKMYKLLSAQELCELVESLRGKTVEWIEESRPRGNRFKEILATGDRRLLILLINTVTEQAGILASRGKRLTAGDVSAFERARKILFEEFSLTTDIADEEELMLFLLGERKCAPRKIPFVGV